MPASAPTYSVPSLARSGRAAIILEKDIWVCWVLQALFSMPDPHPMAFKGDYDAMRATIVADDTPEFDALVEEIRILEANANRPR